MSLPSPFSVEYRHVSSGCLCSRLHSKLLANRPSWSLVEGELIKRTITAAAEIRRPFLRALGRRVIRAEVFKIFSVMFIVFCLISGAFAVYFYKQYTTLLDLKPRRQIFQNNSPVTLTTEGRTR